MISYSLSLFPGDTIPAFHSRWLEIARFQGAWRKILNVRALYKPDQMCLCFPDIYAIGKSGGKDMSQELACGWKWSRQQWMSPRQAQIWTKRGRAVSHSVAVEKTEYLLSILKPSGADFLLGTLYWILLLYTSSNYYLKITWMKY